MFEGLKFPANAMMVIEQMIKLATFDLIPTEFIESEMYYWPESEPFSVNFEISGTESVFLLANIGFVIYIIYYHIFIAIVHACLHKVRNTSTIAFKIHQKIGSYLYWEGFNRLYMELYFDLNFLSILNLHTADWDTAFISERISNYVSAFVLAFVNLVLIVYVVGYLC